MDRDAVYGRVVWVLNNHEVEESILKDQIGQEDAALAEDLDRIYGAVGLKGLNYSDTKVLSSIKQDSKIAAAIAAAEERRHKALERTAGFRIELEAIESIYKLVCSLEGMERAVLLAMYYPRRSYGDVAKMLGYSVRAVSRYRSLGIGHVVDFIINP